MKVFEFMKPTVTYLISITLGSVWPAFSVSSEIIPSTEIIFQEQKDFIILLKSNSASQIKETRQARCPQGLITAFIPRLPYKFNEDTLLYHMMALAPVTLYGKMLNSLQLNFQNMLARFLGKEVTLIQQDATGREIHRPVQFLGSVSPHHWITFHDGLLDFQSPGRIGFPVSRPDILSSLNLYFYNPKEQDCLCTLYYFCPLLFWKVQYIAEVSVQTQTIFFNATLKVHNFSGLDYHKASIVWVAPWLHSKEIQTRTLSRDISIPNGSKYVIPFLSVQKKAVINYCFELNPAEEIHERPVQRRFVLPDLDLEKLPDGPLNIYLKKEPDFIHLGTPLLKQLSPHHLEIDIDQEPAIHATLKQVHMRSLAYDQKEQTYYIDFANDTKAPVEVYVTLRLLKDWNLIDAQSSPKKKAQDLAWVIHIPAKGHSFFWYRITLPERGKKNP